MSKIGTKMLIKIIFWIIPQRSAAMPKPLTLPEPFPTTNDICEDAYSLRIISPAYASSTGELNAILQYIYHSFFFGRYGYADVAEKLVSIAVAEMLHLNILGQTILALGAPPVYCRNPSTGFDFYNAKYVAYSRSLKYMLEDDILGEKQAICDYDNMLKRLKNPQVKKIVSRIRDDEILHVDTLQNILNDFKG